jgi:hypothetical protein
MMLARLTFAGALVLLASCDTSPQTDTASEAERGGRTATRHQTPRTSELPPGVRAITSVSELVGEYRVAEIDDEPLDAPIGIALSIDGSMMSFDPTCAGFVWRLAFEGERLATQRLAAETDAPGQAPPPVCAVAPLPEQARLAEALDAATEAEHTAANGIRLSGGGRSATLFSQ